MREPVILVFVLITWFCVFMMVLIRPRGPWTWFQKSLLTASIVSALSTTVMGAQVMSHQPNHGLRQARQELRIARLVRWLGPSGIPVVDRPLLQRLRDGRPVSAHAENALYRRLHQQAILVRAHQDMAHARQIFEHVLPTSGPLSKQAAGMHYHGVTKAGDR
jgi:hypothetical protein